MNAAPARPRAPLRPRARRVGAVVVARLAQVQIAQGSRYRARAQRQQERRIEISGSRGSILDREGRELAVSVEASSVYAIPDDVAGRARGGAGARAARSA